MRSWFTTDLALLATDDTEFIVGQLSKTAADRRLSLNPESTSAWRTTVNVLRAAAADLLAIVPEAASWHVGLEFEVARRRRRIDAVILARDIVVLIEVKAGSSTFDRASKWQAEQYALDLRDFHFGSRSRLVAPILVATESHFSEPSVTSVHGTVLGVQAVCPEELATRVAETFARFSDAAISPLNPGIWEDSPYRPSPSIVEAAQELYTTHDVREISMSGATNLDATVSAVAELVSECRLNGKRGIAFITGSPGSGKTLAGLQVVHDPRLTDDREAGGVFLSGNMPLVEVITKALAASGTRGAGSRDERLRKVGTFVQHAFAFRNEYAEMPDRIPSEHVVLFDEAQRAWDKEQVSRWTRGASTRSEPQILLDVMNRVPDWSVVVAMVGGGQEINRGEAGLAEWGRVLAEQHQDWLVRASEAVLPGAPSRPGGRLFESVSEDHLNVRPDARLNLTMNVRSPRAERLNRWVDSLLALDLSEARSSMPDAREFPLVMTRSLATAKSWLKDRADPGMQHHAGLVASADARRLRAWGLETNLLKQDRGWADWFLREAGDVRSSNQLEVPATNFDCQGLELDWVGVCWGNDFVPRGALLPAWSVRQFRGTRWVSANEEKSNYILNSYRVLLTRARRGQVIWIPQPDGTDATLEPELFEGIAHLLGAAGVPSLD